MTDETQARNVTSSGAISDSSLAQLREQIKTIMIPLLLKVFHLKLEAQQASSPPSRLTAKPQTGHTDEILSQLEKLDEDLRLLIVWCQSCRNQVGKVLLEIKEELKPPSHIHAKGETTSAVQKSFSDALASQKDSYQKAVKPLQAAKDAQLGMEKEEQAKSPWWTRLIKH